MRLIDEADVVKAIDKHTQPDGTLDDDISCILISILAPARGATEAGNRAVEIVEFQSSLPRGERLFWMPH